MQLPLLLNDFFGKKNEKNEKSSNYRSKTCISQKISKYLSRNTKKSGILLTFDGFMTNQKKNRQLTTDGDGTWILGTARGLTWLAT